MSDIGIMNDVWFYEVWAAIVAVGVVLALLERRFVGRHWLWIVLALAALAGALMTQWSPFTFSGDDYYMLGVIVSAGALLMLAGYTAASLAALAYRRLKRRGT